MLKTCILRASVSQDMYAQDMYSAEKQKVELLTRAQDMPLLLDIVSNLSRNPYLLLAVVAIGS